MTAHLAGQPHTLYRAYDRDDRLLYVGCTAKKTDRIAQQSAAAWWADALYVTLEHFPNRVEARLAEDRAIDLEAPVYNVRRPGVTSWSAEQVRLAAAQASEQAS